MFPFKNDYWVRKRKAKKNKPRPVTSSAKAELPKHGSGVSVHWWELADHGWVKKEG